MKSYLSGENGNTISVTITDVTDPENPASRKTEADYNNAAFELPIDLSPGQILEITYTVKVTNIFLASNDIVELTNTATVGTNGRTLASKTNTETLSQNTWMRKMYGDTISADETITFGPEDGVYCYQNGKIVPEENNPTSFTVEAGSHKYQVVLNENGAWDMSSTSMQDAFGSNYLKYTGYVRIALYERSETNRNTAKSDANLMSELNGLTPVRTVWLKIDGEGSFSFKPEQLGINDKHTDYTYLLTYYAKPHNVGNIGEVSVSNDFMISGDVGVGNGELVHIPQIKVSVSNIVRGGVKFDAEKISRYFTSDPWEKDENGDPTVSLWTNGTLYGNGDFYWIIKLNGTIPKGFVVKDTSDSQMQFCFDSVPLVFRGPKNLDFTELSSFGTTDFASAY